MMLILDTNFLIYLVKYKIVDEVKKMGMTLILPDAVEKELMKLAEKGKNKDAALALLALQVIDTYKAEKKKTKVKNVDKAIVLLALEFKEKGEKVFVGTLDRELSRKLKKLGIGIIKIRQKKYLIKA